MQAGAALAGLLDSDGRQLDFVVGRGGVGVGVEIALRLAVADENDPLRKNVPQVISVTRRLRHFSIASITKEKNKTFVFPPCKYVIDLFVSD